MGFFSWFTSDTNKSIANHYSTRETFPVYMVTEDKQIFHEKDYEGYGEFGGKDLYVLAAEMNGYKGSDDNETRDMFFDKIWRRGIMKDNKKYFYKEHFNRYDQSLASEGNISPNDLVSDYGWENFGDSGDFSEFVKQGYKMPKLVESLPSEDVDWKSWWDSLSYPESCPEQGFFYDDDCDDDDEDF